MESLAQISKRQRLLRGIGNRFFRPARRALPRAVSQQGGDLSLEVVAAQHEAAMGARPEGIDPDWVERFISYVPYIFSPLFLLY